MSQDFEEEKCTRKRININGENYYLIVGRGFVMATVPHQNRPDRANERRVVDSLCEEISEIMRGNR